MSTKILLVTSKKSPETNDRILHELKNKRIEYSHLYYDEITVDVASGVRILASGEELDPRDYLAAWFRMAPHGLIYLKDILVDHFSNQTFVLNGESFLRWPFLSKLTQNYHLAANDIACAATFYGADSHASIVYPAIAKRIFGKQGKGIYKVENSTELRGLIEREKDFSNNYLVQEYLPIKEDYRVLVVGYKALPFVMKKQAPEGQFLTNISQGGIGSKELLTDELREIAEKSARIFQSDYCGVDIMFDSQGKPKVLEINRSASFLGFEKFTGLNAAEEIVKYLMKNVGSY